MFDEAFGNLDFSINILFKMMNDIDSEINDEIIEMSPKGRYGRYLQQLGSGAYKIVYKGIDYDEEMTEIAWNVINVGKLSKREKERVVSEINILLKLQHDNIIKIKAVWYNNTKQEVIFITDLISGGSLKDFITKFYESLNENDKLNHILKWSKQILNALIYIHQQDIIHRDLKCANILINNHDLKIFVSDFGLATLKSKKKNSCVGTIEYMAPEIYENFYDEKVDIYAFGMCLLEMITNEIPYTECENNHQIYKKTITGILPESLNKIKNMKLKKLIKKLIGKKKHRPSAKHLYEIIDSYFT
jgi:WNK lysine deficient protein kinase